jgi:alkanesulfonate monooxygenase SsuD/methylene tetrahydromethanopterin reductase-like flavin-dependent oxidoreductase (luciferase family)
MADHGTDPRVRMSILREWIEAMRQIWTTEEAEYHGKFVDFHPIWSYPKPVQSPLPVLVGGMGPTVEDRVVSFGDGWLAQNVNRDNLDAFADRVAGLQQRAADAGRDRLPISLFGTSSEKGMAERYTSAGIERCLFLLPDGTDAKVTGELDRLAERIR